MRIKNIIVNPLSLGSVEFQIIWECSHCHSENALIRRGSLLTEQDAACSQCEKINHYEYDPVSEISHQQCMKKAEALDQAIQEKIHLANLDAIRYLGHDFLFGVNTYFANRLSEAEARQSTALPKATPVTRENDHEES